MQREEERKDKDAQKRLTDREIKRNRDVDSNVGGKK